MQLIINVYSFENDVKMLLTKVMKTSKQTYIEFEWNWDYQ